MEYAAFSGPSSSSRPRASAFLWAGCGLVCTAGLWLTASSFHAATHATVRAPIASRTTQLGRPALRSTQRNPGALPGAVSLVKGAGTTESRQPSALRAVVEGSGADVVSIAAIIVSLWAATVSLLKARTEPAAPAAISYGAVAAPAPEKPVQMDEVALAVKADQESRKQLTPKQAILELQAGNARFWSGTPTRPELNAIERRALIIAQAPTVCILSCADSRVPVELVFDQGLGSIFVVRVAGNILDATAMGSVEFAVKYLGVKAVLVMGHEGCGAVKGAMSMSAQDLEDQPSYLKQVLLNIKGNLNVQQLGRIQDSRAQDREAVITNASSQVRKLQQNQLIGDRISDGSLIVAGAFYEITSGIVDFFTLDKNGLVTDI